jgi:peroxiredoxin
MSKITLGATLPDFELQDENGDLHRLSELQGDDAMVLMLGRTSAARASVSTSARC